MLNYVRQVWNCLVEYISVENWSVMQQKCVIANLVEGDEQ
jgi:hypothetical protein